MYKIQPQCGTNARIALFTNKFHIWCLRICAGDFQLNLQQKWCGTIQDTTFRQIRTRHMSRHGLEGPPEQETDMTEAKTYTIDKWAQSTTQSSKEEIGWPYWLVGRPPWSADGPVGPTALTLPCGASSLDIDVILERLGYNSPVAPSYK